MQLFGTGKVKPSEWFKPAEEETDGEAFVIAPQKSSLAIRLASVENYSETELAENERIIKATTPYYDGAINWSIAYTGEVVSWDSTYIPPATDCVSITAIDSRTCKVTCLRDFGQQIKLTASRADFPDKQADCVCDYKQRHFLGEMFIGFNSFLPNGTIGRALVDGIGSISSPQLIVGEGEPLKYRVSLKSSAYTITTTAPTNFHGLNFEFNVNANWVEQFGFEDYNFKSYSGNFNDSLTGTIGGFFDRSWFEYGVSDTDNSVDEFATDLINATADDGWYGIDSVPAYTLSISGLPDTTEVCCFDVWLDIYELSLYVEALANATVELALDNSQIDF